MEGALVWMVVAAVASWWWLRRRARPDVRPVRRPTRAARRQGRKRWSTLLDRPDVLILDTETTGLGERAEVIEIAVLDTTGAVRYEALSLPVGRITAGAVAVHGLTRQRLKDEGARPWPEVHAELAAVLAGASVVLAWRAAFDRRMLDQTAARHELAFADAPPMRDAMADYRAIRREGRAKGRHTLVAVADRERIGQYEAHRATGDCRAVLAVMRAVAGEGAT